MTMALLIGKYSMIPVYVLCIALCYPVSGEPDPVRIQNVTATGEYGKDAVLTCLISKLENPNVQWMIEGKTEPINYEEGTEATTPTVPVTGTATVKYTTEIRNQSYILKIANATEDDARNYTCVVQGEARTEYLNLSFPGKPVSMKSDPKADSNSIVQFNLPADKNKTLTLTCEFEVYDQTEIEWVLQRYNEEDIPLNGTTTKNMKKLTGTYSTQISKESFDIQNGTHICRVWDSHGYKNLTSKIHVKIVAHPVVAITFAKPVSSSAIYLNWTVKQYNSDIKRYELRYKNTTETDYHFSPTSINKTANFYVLGGLAKNTTYELKLKVETGAGSNHDEVSNLTTLPKDPDFVPNISINGFTARSMTIGLSAPPSDIAEYVHYYQLEVWKKIDKNNTTENAVHIRDDRNLPYMFNNLDPHTTYVFRAKACFEYGGNYNCCGNWSKEMEALTMDGIPNEPNNSVIHCGFSVEQGYYMNLTWEQPTKPNAEIKGYMMEVTGNATYIDRFGKWKMDTFGPLTKLFTNETFLARVPDLKPNMNYTVRLMAMTRSRRRGQEKVDYCTTGRGPPDFPPRPSWRKVTLDPDAVAPVTVARLTAMTRSRRRGQEKVDYCTTGRGPPDFPPRPSWRKVEEKKGDTSEYSLRVRVPRIAERNGPICCYRVYLVRLPKGKGWISTNPQDLPVITWADAHAANSDYEEGAYVTDIFNHDYFPKVELILGDNISENITREEDNNTCSRCFERPLRKEPPTTAKIAIVTAEPDYDEKTTEAAKTKRSLDIRKEPPTTAKIAIVTAEPDYDEKTTEAAKTKRSLDIRFQIELGLNIKCFDRLLRKEPLTTAKIDVVTAEPDYDEKTTEVAKTKRSLDIREDQLITPTDGKLDPSVNYTLFVELIPGTDDPSLYSSYTNALNTAIPPQIIAANNMETALQICCGVAALLLLATIIFCVVHTRRARKQPLRHAHVELNPIQAALRYVVGHIGGRTPLVSAPPPDMPPIALEDLAAAYAERQADSDYGFQKEFELLQMLPECYPDRTTHASEARENQPKNRYPDIKAYDQTRVKLSQIDGITGSDYINANYVMGYKEHKQFICAQGPTDTTVNDFWRMIWEHGLELIVMLTNLEEYSKVKCSKYWPDEDRGSRAFGAITVHHVSEKRYSDYIVRELKIVKQATNSEGQPIVENNGVAKRNGDCKDPESGSAPTSPREVKDNTRVVRQYHFLMWKDFAAPEHPQSILKFIKRMNEAWSHLMGRPVVVHCSAGVGRTGTLVALDCLLEQLRTTRRAAVFTTVAELRRQRNFLVQSLKQYIFVYRALVEYAHYGDTEIPASRLKSSIDRLRNTAEGADKCLMEHEFEKMMNPPVTEPVKSCSAGSVEEARAKNRSPEYLPYDRNRVILAPAPPLHYSTYINASFIEAYDNSEGFIITQDPLPNTIMDFWRMVSEHNVSTIVMLSELGEGKCPRYWDDGTAQYEHISVQYEESESCPYYTRRQFRVTNNKSGDVCVVRQLQYQGWPTAPGHVPEVTRGLAELADAARQQPTPAMHAEPAMLLHCQYGTERSALFAALCILIAQLRNERRVDVAATARKVRSQRAGTINTFLQYEFLHRAILNYAELHNLLEDS
ncbi:tyrosine-protein phosphatase 69D [Cydia fagiglandana]|uniref:tyrosine-protein phosphatase 69D n=1 Tax=Cydia fagiglandana TaxID=1458189 RepID=UPI002FEE40C6